VEGSVFRVARRGFPFHALGGDWGVRCRDLSLARSPCLSVSLSVSLSLALTLALALSLALSLTHTHTLSLSLSLSHPLSLDLSLWSASGPDGVSARFLGGLPAGLRGSKHLPRPQSGSKSSFAKPRISTTGRRIPASSSTNEENYKGDLIPF